MHAAHKEGQRNTHKSLQKQNTKNKRRAESQLELEWRSVEEANT